MCNTDYRRSSFIEEQCWFLHELIRAAIAEKRDVGAIVNIAIQGNDILCGYVHFECINEPLENYCMKSVLL